MTDFAALRARMVERQLRRRGIGDERVLAAMGEVPREAFVPARLRHRAYADSALPIGAEQTISQPWIVAAICQALELTRRRAGARGRHRLGLLGLRALAARRRGGQRRAPRGARRCRPARRSPRSASTNVELLGRRRQPRRPRARARSRRSRSTPPRPAPPPALIAQLAEGGRMVIPIAAERDRPADPAAPPRRRDRGRDARPLPLRAADRRGGF